MNTSSTKFVIPCDTAARRAKVRRVIVRVTSFVVALALVNIALYTFALLMLWWIKP